MKLEILSKHEFKLVTEVELGKLFKYEWTNRKYEFWNKSYSYFTDTAYLYHRREDTHYYFWIGWLMYVVAIYHEYIEDEDMQKIREFMSHHFEVDNDKLYRDWLTTRGITEEENEALDSPFYGLREQQLEDLNHLLKYRHGLFQVTTGYGKTDLQAALAHLLSEAGHVVVILTPTDATKAEITHRMNWRYGYEFEYYDPTSNVNIFNVNGFCRSHLYEVDDPFWSTVDYIIGEECELVVNEKGDELISLCSNLKGAYGFSATAEKFNADPLVFSKDVGLVEMLTDNRSVVNNFGSSIVYRIPEGLDLNLYEINTSILDRVTFTSSEDKPETYASRVRDLFGDDEFSELICRVAKKFKPLFLPINRTTILDDLLIYHFLPKGMNVLNICGRGFEYYKDGSEEEELLSIEESKELLRSGKVDIVTATRSGFRALDFPEIKSVFHIVGKHATEVVQYIGRATRNKEFNVIGIKSRGNVPSYTEHYNNRINMINSYYRRCNIKHIELTEDYFNE